VLEPPVLCVYDDERVLGVEVRVVVVVERAGVVVVTLERDEVPLLVPLVVLRVLEPLVPCVYDDERVLGVVVRVVVVVERAGVVVVTLERDEVPLFVPLVVLRVLEPLVLCVYDDERVLGVAVLRVEVAVVLRELPPVLCE
jgi:hypothetical protein